MIKCSLANHLFTWKYIYLLAKRICDLTASDEVMISCDYSCI